MKIRSVAIGLGLVFLAGCASYANIKRVNSNYTYEGKTYSVWTAQKTEGGRTRTVFLLDNLESSPVLGDDAIAECSGPTLAECEKTFGIRLSQQTPKRDEGGMGY